MRLLGFSSGMVLMLALFCPRIGYSVQVDLELMMLVDSSGSIILDEWNFQRDAIGDAVQDPTVTSLFDGTRTVALSVYFWAGDAGGSAGVFEEGVGWTQISTPNDAMQFGNQLKGASRPDISTMPRAQTGVSRAINQAIPLFDNNGFEGDRKLIDISGDGSENLDRKTSDPSPFPDVPVDLSSFGMGLGQIDVPVVPLTGWGFAQEAHDAALAAGIGINGLVMLSGLDSDKALVKDTFEAAQFVFAPPVPRAQDFIDAAVAEALEPFGEQAVVEIFYERILIGAPVGDPEPLLFVAPTVADFPNAIQAKLVAEIPEPMALSLLIFAAAGLVLRRSPRARCESARPGR